MCADLPPLVASLQQIAIDCYVAMLLTVIMNTSFISFLKEHAADLLA